MGWIQQCKRDHVRLCHQKAQRESHQKVKCRVYHQCKTTSLKLQCSCCVLVQFHKVWGQLMKTGYQSSRFAHQVIERLISCFLMWCLVIVFSLNRFSSNSGGEIRMPVHEPSLQLTVLLAKQVLQTEWRLYVSWVPPPSPLIDPMSVIAKERPSEEYYQSYCLVLVGCLSAIFTLSLLSHCIFNFLFGTNYKFENLLKTFSFYLCGKVSVYKTH